MSLTERYPWSSNESHDFIQNIAFASAALAFDYAGPGAVNWREGIIWLSLYCDRYSAQLRAKITW